MKKQTTEELLSHLDEALSEAPTVVCWRCNKAPGQPSLCGACKSEVGYEHPPKGTKRVIWEEESS